MLSRDGMSSNWCVWSVSYRVTVGHIKPGATPPEKKEPRSIENIIGIMTNHSDMYDLFATETTCELEPLS